MTEDQVRAIAAAAVKDTLARLKPRLERQANLDPVKHLSRVESWVVLRLDDEDVLKFQVDEGWL